MRLQKPKEFMLWASIHISHDPICVFCTTVFFVHSADVNSVVQFVEVYMYKFNVMYCVYVFQCHYWETLNVGHCKFVNC